MTVSRERALFICPDYVSHFFPMSAIAEECARRGMAVTVATGPGLRARVAALDFDHVELILGPGNNTGILRLDEQAVREAEHMKAFFDATRLGPVETLLHQSRAREHDMLWEPVEVHARLSAIIASVRPDFILVDQLAYAGTLALHAMQIPFASFVPSNPSGLPGPQEYFGFPSRLPAVIKPPASEWQALRRACIKTDMAFTRRFNDVLTQINSYAPPVESAFRHTSSWLVLLNYPAVLAGSHLHDRPGPTYFIGSSIRVEPPNPRFDSLLAAMDPTLPCVYVSLGTFLSARDDVLSSIGEALRRAGVLAIMATGTSGERGTADLPRDWIVAPSIPQIAALRRADLVITHGGNNTVTEALAHGIPLLVAPFSSDQFDSAADIEAGQLGAVFDPNRIDIEGLTRQIAHALSDQALRGRTQRIGHSLLSKPGQAIAADLLHLANTSGR